MAQSTIRSPASGSQGHSDQEKKTSWVKEDKQDPERSIQVLKVDIDRIRHKFKRFNDDMSDVTVDHMDQFKTSINATLKLVRDHIVSSSFNNWIEWLYQQKAFLEEIIDNIIDKKTQIRNFEKEKEELTRYKNEASQKILREMKLPQLKSSLDLDHFNEILTMKHSTILNKKAPHLLIALKQEVIDAVEIETLKSSLSQIMTLDEIIKVIYAELANLDRKNIDCINLLKSYNLNQQIRTGKIEKNNYLKLLSSASMILKIFYNKEENIQFGLFRNLKENILIGKYKERFETELSKVLNPLGMTTMMGPTLEAIANQYHQSFSATETFTLPSTDALFLQS